MIADVSPLQRQGGDIVNISVCRLIKAIELSSERSF